MANCHILFCFLPLTWPWLGRWRGQHDQKGSVPQDSGGYDPLRAEMTFNSVSQMPPPGPNTEKALIKLLDEYMKDEFENVSQCREKNAI